LPHGGGRRRGAQRGARRGEVEHDTAKILINEILHGGPDDPFWKAKVTVLCDQIKHHVEEEEKPGDGIMAKAQSSGIDTGELANRLMRRKTELQGRAADLRPIGAVSLHQPSHQEEDMPRDPRGHAEAARRGWEERRGSRYEDDDDRYYRRSRYDEDEDDRRGRSGHGGWFGDPRGHAEAARRGWRERR
jgi:hypothetical protein